MAFVPISGIVPQATENGNQANGMVLKFYEPGTLTPLTVGIDSTGVTQTTEFVLSIEGYTTLSGNEEIPHVDQIYKIVLYLNQADADANDTGSAVYVIDDVDVGDFATTLAPAFADYDNLSLAVDSSVGAIGEFITTGEYNSGTGVGGGEYRIVAGGTGAPDGVIYINKTDGSGFQLELQHEGTVDLFQGGAVGDGDLDLTSLPSFSGTDDTARIQACLDLLISRTVNKLTAGKGIFNFTDLKCYDSLEILGLRGNFTLEGSGKSNPTRLAAGALSTGTTFKCTSLTGSLDVNTVNTAGGTAIDFNTSMSDVIMGDFNIIGSTTSELIRFDVVVGASYIHDISIVNDQVDGIAMYCRSNFTTRFEGIDGRGSIGSLANRLGTGLFYDTDLGGGSMATFISCTFGEFGDAWYIGHTSLAAPTHGGIGSSSIFMNCQGQRSTNNFHIGKTTDDIDVNGQILLNFIGCYFELGDETNMLIEFDSSVNLDKCEIRGGVVSLGNIAVQNEQSPDILQGGKISITNSLILNSPGSDFLVLPAGSYYSVYSKENTGRSFGDTVYGLPASYFGLAYFENDQIEGIPITSTEYISFIEYAHPESQILIQRAFNTGNDAGAVDLSDRPYIPKVMLMGTLTADASLELPDGLDSVMDSSNTSVAKINSANLLNINSSSANIYMNGRTPVFTITITDNDFIYKINTVNLGLTIRHYISTDDPLFANYSGLPDFANDAAAGVGGVLSGYLYLVTASDPRQVAMKI